MARMNSRQLGSLGSDTLGVI